MADVRPGPYRESVGVTIDTNAVGPFLESKTSAIRAALAQKMTETVAMLQMKILGKLEGEVLHHRTGKLVTSVREGAIATVVSADEITGGVAGGGGPAWYGRLHEYGGTFEVPEGRRVALGTKASRAKLMLQAKRGGYDFITHVQSKPYSITFPERSFMRSTLTENEEEIRAGFQNAAKEAAAS